MKLSVVIPFYNVGKYLPATLESLSRQTCRGFELLIVDDGSDEPESLELLERLRGEGYRVLRKPNGGLGSARNLGFREASGEWVAPIDADDLVHPRYLETLLGAVERDPSLTFAAMMFRSFYEDPEEVVSGYVPLALDADLLAFHNIAGPGAGSILHRGRVLEAGGYDEWLTSFEDWDLWCTLAGRGHRGVVIPEFLLYYRLRAGSLIRSEAMPRWHALKAYLIAKHPRLARDPGFALRLQLWETHEQMERVRELEERLRRVSEGGGSAIEASPAAGGVDATLLHHEVMRVVRSNIRYRVADRLNGAAKSLGVHGALKRAYRAIRGR